jgi:dienelactone hydrolase
MIGRFVGVLLLGLLSGCAGGAPDKVSFPTVSGGVTIKATVYHPSGPGPFPAIVLLHHCAGIDGTLLAAARHFTDEGYVTIVPDSFGPRGTGSVCASQRVSALDRLPDAYAAANYLRSLPDVRGDRIGVIGWSHGAGVVTVLVSRPPMGAPFRAAVAYYPTCVNRPARVNVPTLVLSGEKDDWDFAAPCVAWGKAVHDPALLDVVVYPGAWHAFDVPRGPHDVEGGRGSMHHLEYNEAADKDAHARTEAFFAQWLK